ncbi:NO-binding membrane sensor protein with MHYT domain [Micromonospora pisi]|uniref:NO-binding membrane sensor protein with MHYT domain n=1 Tax=Micromonospora pisi TaxID=589240 RepID=A0A495JW89_9ACTN|nr:MHYT domain-containing protein [Micromonospora pisi]RKR92612.1 NO-binding membrane sensor protein with MHYT domain [Micromonospora pisi]
MAEIHHFAYGWLTPSASYLLAVLGSALGLTCTVRLRQASNARQRVWWLILAAWAIGGTAIWTMHFMAMLGFSVVGTAIRYDIGLTAASAVLAVVTVGIGLFVVGLGRTSVVKVLIGGLFTGLGVAAMHYVGMAAMRLNGHVAYGRDRVIASVVIAVVAATVALWLAVTVRGRWAIAGSALVMGIAVSGMHYTGMSAMSVQLHDRISGAQPGASASTLLLPIVLTVIFGLITLVYAVLAAPTEEDRAAVAYLNVRGVTDRVS